MEYLERQYLLAAYELARNDPMHMFNEDDIVNHLDLDPNDPDFVNRFTSLTRSHLDRGFLASGHKGGGTGRSTLKLTGKGLEEAERLADPIEQRKEQRRRFLRAVYRLADGNPAEFVDWRDVAPELGWDPTNHEHEEQGIALAEYAERSRLITIEVNEGTVYRITEKGVDEVEGNKPSDAGSTFNIYGPVHGSVIGTHNKAELTNSFDFRSIEERIEREGGEDKEELKRALAQVERLLERGEYLDRGALAQYSEEMERHSWFTGAVAQALIGFATQAIGG